MQTRARGWLVVNRFLNNNKFSDIAERLITAARAQGTRLDLHFNDGLLPAMGGEAFGLFDILPDEKPDFVLFYDKDIRLAVELERRGMSLFNNSRAIAICDDKGLTHAALSGLVPMPLTYSAPFTYENIGYNDLSFAEKLLEKLGLPVVIKEACGSFGQQVYLARSMEEVGSILRAVGGKRVIFQEFIEECAGRDLRLNVVGGRVIAAMERRSENGDFRANVTIGGTMKKYSPSREEEALAIRAAKLIGLDFCGVDILQTSRGPLVLEVNSNAHFKSIYDCTGVNAADEILAHILRSTGA